MKIKITNGSIQFLSKIEWEKVELLSPGCYVADTGVLRGYDSTTDTFTNSNCVSVKMPIEGINKIRFSGAGLNVNDHNVGFYTGEIPSAENFLASVSYKDTIGGTYGPVILDLAAAKKAGAKYLVFGDYSKPSDNKASFEVFRV